MRIFTPRSFVYLLQLVVFVLCIVWLAGNIEWKNVYNECKNVSICMLGIILVQRYFPWAVLGKRLSIVFEGRMSSWTGFKGSLLCVGCNSILPARLGELVKIAWFHGISGMPVSHLCSGVLLERLLDVSCLLLLAIVFAMPLLNIWLVFAMALAVLLAWYILSFLSAHVEARTKIVDVLPLPDRIRNWLLAFLESVSGILGKRVLPYAVVATLFVWLMNYVHVLLLANCLMDMGLQWHQIGLLCVAMFFSSALLLAPGGVGLMEMTLIVVLSNMGVDTTKAASMAVFARLFYSFPAIFGALVVTACSRHAFSGDVRQVFAQLKNKRLQ